MKPIVWLVALVVALLVAAAIVTAFAYRSMNDIHVDNFQDQFQYKPCAIYYTDKSAGSYSEAVELRDACDAGHFDHSPVYYDAMANRETDKKAKYMRWKNVYNSLPTIHGSNWKSMKTCKVDIPGWRQQWLTGEAPTMSPRIPDDTRLSSDNWAFCVAPANDNVSSDVHAIESTGQSGITFAKQNDGALMPFQLDNDYYYRARFGDLNLKAIVPLYCARTKTNMPFRRGLKLTLNAAADVIDIQYIVDGQLSTKEHLNITTLFATLFSGQKAKTIGNMEYTFVEPLWSTFSVVKMSRDVCNVDTKAVVGTIDMRMRLDRANAADKTIPSELKNTIVVKAVINNNVNTNPSYELGVPGMSPWNNSGFADGSAKWIWNSQGAASWAPANQRISFQQMLNNIQEYNVNVTLHMIVDDVATIYLNDVKKGDVSGVWWAGANYPKIALSLNPGQNVLKIIALNGGGPAGLLYAVLGANGQPIIHSDTSTRWYM